MPARQSSPAQLPSVFSVNEANALGLSRGWLRHPALSTPYFGVRCLPDTLPLAQTAVDRTLQCARLFLPRMRPGEMVSHHSALLLYSCPIHADRTFHVSAQPTHTRNRTLGVTGHRLALVTTARLLHGIPVAEPLSALLQSAASLQLRELIVAIDHLTRPRGYRGARPPYVEPEELRIAVERFRGRGARKLQGALELATARAESRMETLTWLLLIAFGLSGELDLQVDVKDTQGWVGRFDFVNLKKRVIVEYDGEQHRIDRTQYAHDLRRLDRARAAGYVVIRLLSEDVLHRPYETADRIAEALGINIEPHRLFSQLVESR